MYLLTAYHSIYKSKSRTILCNSKSNTTLKCIQVTGHNDILSLKSALQMDWYKSNSSDVLVSLTNNIL